MNEQQCTKELGEVLSTSTRVAVLLEAIFALDTTALKRGITCRPCKETVQEVIMMDTTKVLCCEHMKNRQDIEETVVHELVHAFDSTRQGKFNSLCHAIACGEVRASCLGKYM
ncbi:peptidase M76 [Spinellus fusiger]|nr:peptidase M76 [Spinellus fusiger]